MADGKQSVLFKGMKEPGRRIVDSVHIGDKQLVRGVVTPNLTADEVKQLKDDQYYEDYAFDFNPKEDDK